MGDEIRAGARGGRGLFSWEDVERDKRRAFYLGNSVKLGSDPKYAKSTLGLTDKKWAEAEAERRALIEKEKQQRQSK